MIEMKLIKKRQKNLPFIKKKILSAVSVDKKTKKPACEHGNQTRTFYPKTLIKKVLKNNNLTFFFIPT